MNIELKHKVVKKKTGETPAKFIHIHKLETAKRLIEETDLPISEIMSRAGILDATQFAKKFRGLYGNAPCAYRQDIRGMKKTFKKRKVRNSYAYKSEKNILW